MGRKWSAMALKEQATIHGHSGRPDKACRKLFHHFVMPTLTLFSEKGGFLYNTKCGPHIGDRQCLPQRRRYMFRPPFKSHSPQWTHCFSRMESSFVDVPAAWFRPTISRDFTPSAPAPSTECSHWYSRYSCGECNWAEPIPHPVGTPIKHLDHRLCNN